MIDEHIEVYTTLTAIHKGGAPPFLTFPIFPKRTFHRILDTDPDFGLVILGILEGITSALRSSVIHGLHPLPDLMGLFPLLDDILRLGIGESPSMPLTLATIFIYGSFLGIVLILAGGALLRFTGILMGGKIRHRGHRAAVAWAFSPYIWMLLIWAIYAVVDYTLLRSASFPYGLVVPWEIGDGIGILLALDYGLRALSLFYLILNCSIVQRVSFGRAAVMVTIAFVPPYLLLVRFFPIGV